jgi:hypothetical protein
MKTAPNRQPSNACGFLRVAFNKPINNREKENKKKKRNNKETPLCGWRLDVIYNVKKIFAAHLRDKPTKAL